MTPPTIPENFTENFAIAVEGAGLKLFKNRLDVHYKTSKKTSKAPKTSCVSSILFIFRHLMQGRGRSLFYLFRMWQMFLTRIFSIFVSRISPFNISGTLRDSAFKFSALVETINIFCCECSKLGVSPKYGPHGGSNFQIGPLRCAP